MNKHTPGPWTYEGMGCQVGGPDRVLIADTFELERTPETRQANARLIAAAPDLLAALETAEAIIDGPIADATTGDMMSDTGAYDALVIIRDAIAKARGE